MKYLLCILVICIGFAACKKKEEDRYCWQCTRTTDINYIYMGVETETRTMEDSSVCGLTEAEMRDFVSSNKISFTGTYQGTTADYKSSMECLKQ